MSDMTATLHTTAGDIEVELYEDRVPNTVENFVALAEGADDYDGTEVGPGTGAWEEIGRAHV